MNEHCLEHEKRGDRLTKAEACLVSIKRERDTQYNHMKDVQDDIYEKIESLASGKVDMGTFKWIMSGVGAVAMLILITLMAQVSTLSDVKADLRVLTAKTER